MPSLWLFPFLPELRQQSAAMVFLIASWIRQLGPFGNPSGSSTARTVFETMITNGTPHELVAHVDLSGPATEATGFESLAFTRRTLVTSASGGIFHQTIGGGFLHSPVHLQP